jgi:hypothetical protein
LAAGQKSTSAAARSADGPLERQSHVAVATGSRVCVIEASVGSGGVPDPLSWGLDRRQSTRGNDTAGEHWHVARPAQRSREGSPKPKKKNLMN